MGHARRHAATLMLLASLGLCAQEPKPAPQAEPKAQTPATAKAPTKPKAKKTPKGDDARVKPEVAIGSKVRSRQLKAQKAARKKPTGPLVDINHASKADLMKLPGMTEAYADKLIAKRPFKTKAHMVTQDAIPYGLYTSIKDKVEAGQ